MADGGHLGNEPEKVPSRFLRYVSFFFVLIDTSMILNQQVSFMFQFFPGSRILRASSMRLQKAQPYDRKFSEGFVKGFQF